ncbi:MAG: DEAD/DEAH box helicase, partial [Cryomorphaceae bacterium]
RLDPTRRSKPSEPKTESLLFYMNNNNRKRRPSGSKQQGNGTFNPRSRKPSRGKNGGGRKASTLDPSLLVRKATGVTVESYRSSRTIEDLPVDERIIQCLLKKGFTHPTEIQDKTIEHLLAHRDVLGIAQTGTGKTGAFLIPIIQDLLRQPKKPFALILVPTRELATQVEEEFKSMTKGLNLFSACFIGGTNINRDLQNLRRPSHVIIATPGRLLDLVSRKMIDLRVINTLVLDEFDRMLDMGFEKDVMRIISGMRARQQSLLFSATLDNSQRRLIDEILNEPVTVKVSSGDTTGDHIDQDIIRLNPGEDKLNVLTGLISDESYEKVLVFEETKRRVSKLCKQLNQLGIESEEIHGNKSQNARQTALNKFKAGKVRVLVATDVASRGIDVSDVTHVINYEVPQTFDSYIHRIGRTGRAGRKGMALTFVS